MTTEEMRQRLLELNDEAVEIQALGDTEHRDLSNEEQETLADKLEQYEEVKKQFELRQRLEAQQREIKNVADEPGDGANRKTEPDPPGRTAGDLEDRSELRHVSIRVTDRGDRDPKWGWRHYGDFARAVRAGASKGGSVDPRLQRGEQRATLSTYSNEASGTDGGFAIPPDFKAEIATILTAEESLLSRTDQQTSSSNVFTVPKDETTPWGTTGVRAYWEGEAAALTQSKLALEISSLRLHKLSVLVPVTDELLEDAPSLGNYLTRKAPLAMRSKVDTAIVGGSGSGQPLGIIGAPGTIAVAAESGPQTADTVNRLNVEKIWTRCYAEWRSRAVWLINQDVETELMHMYGIDTESTPLSTWPIYLPAGGYSAAPFATLFGRPIIYTQACETLGDLGDIVLADLMQYLTVTKIGGIRADISIHLWFDQDTTAYRFILRIAGQPWWAAPMSARDGSTTYSPFVTLAERAG